MKANSEKGFTLLESILVVLVISGISLIGYYIYRQNHQTEITTTPASSITPKTEVKKSSSTSSNSYIKTWPTISPADTSYSVQYPKGWVANKCDQNTLLIGPSDIAAGKCNSDAIAQIMLTTSDGEMRDNYELKAQDYPDLNNSEVTVSGVKGYLQTGTLQTVGDTFIGPPSGTKAKQYIFVKDGKTYIFTYMQTPEFNDKVSYFDQMVTKTVKF